MTWLIFFIITFFASLAAVAILVTRHFEALAGFDEASIPRAHEKTTKHALVVGRIQRNLKKFGLRAREYFGPIARGWEFFQRSFRNFANNIADHVRHQEWKQKWTEWKSRSRHDRRAHLLKLLEQGDEHRRAGRYTESEKIYVEIISLDPKNVSAYIGLGKTYFNQDRWNEAEEAMRHVVEHLDAVVELAWAFLGRALKAQAKWAEASAAFKHALKVNPHLAKRWIDLGDCYREMGGVAEAIGAFKKAVEIEPHNPKVLDQLVEISIISGDKRLAREAFLQLREANPENQKLGEWEARIEGM